jgi:CRP-like cAMP-binding protein
MDLEPGQVLFTENANDATLYIIALGILQFVRGSGSATSQTIGCMGAGDYVGELGLLTGSPHAVTATALTRARIYKLSRAALNPLLAGNEHLAGTLEKSVRRGMALINRDVAVRVSAPLGAAGQLLSRIRAFFRSASPQ